jgi:IS5 family transposase
MVEGRSAVEPVIGHLKAEHRMDRCWLAGAAGDALHAVLCAAGYDMRWLMRAVARLGLAGFFALCALFARLAIFRQRLLVG